MERASTVSDTLKMQITNTTGHITSIPYKPKCPGLIYQAVIAIYTKDSSGWSTGESSADYAIFDLRRIIAMTIARSGGLPLGGYGHDMQKIGIYVRTLLKET